MIALSSERAGLTSTYLCCRLTLLVAPNNKGELKNRGDSRANDEDLIRKAATAAAWQTIAEIKSAIYECIRTGRDLVHYMNNAAPSISLDTYLSRLRDLSKSTSSAVPVELLEEAFLLVHLLWR